MSTYAIERKIITRFNCPSNSDVHKHIESIEIENLGLLSTPEPVNIGDIIMIENTPYDVAQKIFANGMTSHSEDIVLRVQPHAENHIYRYGSREWVEEDPLFPIAEEL